jgi:hypothetical protein
VSFPILVDVRIVPLKSGAVFQEIARRRHGIGI